MGLYSDIQNDLGQAFSTDLADAVKTISFITIVNVYDEGTLVSTQTPTPVDKECVIIRNLEGEEVNQETLENYLELLMLDEERGTLSFYIDMKITYDGGTFVLTSFEPDPAFASWVIKARRLG